MGEVYRARDTRLNREVAIKMLPEHLSGDPELRERCLTPASPVRDFFMVWFFLLFFISGFCSILYEIVWLRLAMAQFGVTSALTSIVLSMFMAGLGLGSWGAGRLIRIYEEIAKTASGFPPCASTRWRNCSSEYRPCWFRTSSGRDANCCSVSPYRLPGPTILAPAFASPSL